MRLAIALTLVCLGCGGAPDPKPKKQSQAFRTADPRVGQYISIPWGFTTSSYWIEGPDGLIVVDTQFLPSAAKDMIAKAEAITGKPVKLAIVLHPNPDKFNGVATFQAHGAKVVTAQQVLDLIPAVHTQRHGRFYEDHKPDYPNQTPQPESFGAETTTLEAGGVAVKAHVLPGPGCSAAHVVVQFEDHVFVGDLVANGHHAWLEIGETEAWLERLAEITALGPKHVHPGRGRTGGPELLENQREYLQFVLDQVTAQRPTLPPPKGAFEPIYQAIKARYPDYGYFYFLKIGVPAVWRSVAEQQAQ